MTTASSQALRALSGFLLVVVLALYAASRRGGLQQPGTLGSAARPQPPTRATATATATATASGPGGAAAAPRVTVSLAEMRELALAAAAEAAAAAAGRPGPASASTRPGSRPRPLAARPLVPPARDPLSARVLLSARPPRGPPLPFVLQELSLRGAAAAATARPRWGAEPEGNATRPRGRSPRGSDDATLAGAVSPTRSEPEPRAAGRLDDDGDDDEEYEEEYEEEEGDAELSEATGRPRRRPRARRQAAERRPPHRAELAVCDSENVWVTDKAHAVDLKGHNVTVLSDIRVEGTALRQYFFETRCRASRHTRDGCRGIDRAHWSSQCRTVQSFVQALTSKGGRNLGWRWIRIDTACVCALSQRRP